MPTNSDGRNVVKEWEYNDYTCRVVVVKENHYCGYVQTDLDGSYTDYNGRINVHGGLTYGVDEDGWLGFDCAHLGDMCYRGENALTDRVMGDVQNIWYLSDVVQETERLADQVSEM